MGRKPTVTARESHSPFAEEIRAYLDSIRVAAGMSGRDVAALSKGARSNSWWATIFNGEKTLTTNDIYFISTELLGITPYQFVANARLHATHRPVPFVTFNVGPHPEDYEISEEPDAGEAMAAEKPREP